MDFDFGLKDTTHDTTETATSGSPVERSSLQQTPMRKTPNAITQEIKDEARVLAESPKGLDIAAFQRKHNIYVMNMDELLG